MESIVGRDVAGYRVEALVGRGGMGVVYRARHRSLDRLVALKVIAPDLAEDPTLRERFVRESRLAASIDHPNVVTIYEADEHDRMLYIAMRFIEGGDLKQLLNACEFLPLERVSRIVGQVAAGLDAAHARGLVHRDVKPANVLLATSADGSDHAYLTDFGLVKRSASEGALTKTGGWAGTIDYVAPEQLRGDPVDARADVYALGCLLFETLTGEVPFPRERDVAKLWAHLSEPPPTLARSKPDLPPALDAVIAGGDAKIVLDLSAVEFIDSTGLSVLLNGLRQVNQRKGRMALVCTNPTVLRLFQITSLDVTFAICSDRATAIASVGQPAAGSSAGAP